MFVVYAIFNQQNRKVYIGQTENLEARIKMHNDHTFRSSYTARYNGKWLLFYKEEFLTRHDALIREKQLKSYRGREFLKTFIPW